MGDTVLLQISAHAQVAGLGDSVKEVLYLQSHISSTVIFSVYMLWARKGVGFSFAYRNQEAQLHASKLLVLPHLYCVAPSVTWHC